MPSTQISKSQARTHIRATFSPEHILEGAVGTTAGEFLEAAEGDLEYAAPIMGAIIDGQLRELDYPIKRDVNIAPVLLDTSDGGRIYRRSLVFLMVTAADKVWPGTQISVRYAVPDGGFYCTRLNAPPFNPQDLGRLEAHMREIVSADAPITKREASLEEIRALFAARDEQDKVRLLEQRERPSLMLYELLGREDTYYGYMLPSTGALKHFRLIWTPTGFILQYPRKDAPGILRPIRAYDKLGRVFSQADEWLLRMGIEDVGRLNRLVGEEKRLNEIMLVAEALHEQNIANIAGEIERRHQSEGTRLVLIAGPSSSGKTTFSKRLAIQLLAHGLRPFTLELDNYFVDRKFTPLDEDGNYNFEALEAINLSLFNQHLQALTAGEEVILPRFDFLTGQSVPDRAARLSENQILVVEGIHGLNPNLVPDVKRNVIHRVYVSALTQLNIDNHNRVPTTDVRLLRRIVRDARTRGYTATDTLERWSSVRRGERRNIFPYQENADSMFDSALVYELAALRPMVESLLLQVKRDIPAHIEAKRLLSFLTWVRPLAPHHLGLIPDTSLLREFIGGSILKDYHPTSPGEKLD